MSHKLEATSDAHLHAQVTSHFGRLRLEISPSPPPLAEEALPEHYNLALLELLVVDPEYVFISWEITEGQLQHARETLGEPLFSQRKLVVRLLDADHGDDLLAETQLYGELGRWFLHAEYPGTLLVAELGYRSGNSYLALNSAGPVLLPRTRITEATEYQELKLAYTKTADGALRIASVQPVSQPIPPHLPTPVGDVLAGDSPNAGEIGSIPAGISSVQPGISNEAFYSGIFPADKPKQESKGGGRRGD